MARRSIVRWLVIAILTAALVASVVTMFAVEGGVDEVWLYATLTLYGVAFLLYWLISAGTKARPQSDADVADKVAAAIASRQARSSEVLAEPEPEIVVEPSRTEPIVFPVAAPAAAGFQFRGYTLYGRGGSRFFSKSAPPGATAIELPSGYEAKWDDKKGKPVLVDVTAASVDEPEVVQDVAQKACSAMVAPGEFCENIAKAGSKYCAKHANSHGVEEVFEVRKPGTVPRGKTPKFSAPAIEVRLAKPAPKPLKFKHTHPPSIEVRLAKPSNTKPLEYKRGKPVEVNVGRPSSKPLKLRPAGNIEVEQDRRDAGKPLKLRAANEPVVRLAKPSAGKPVRFAKAAEPVVRVAKPPTPKPLRLKPSAEPSIREDRATVSKAKGKQLAASALVVKTPSNAPVKKGKQLAASDVVVKKPGVAKPTPPLRVGTPELVVRKPGAAAPARPSAGRAREPEIVVVKDTKRRTMLGLAGDGRQK